MPVRRPAAELRDLAESVLKAVGCAGEVAHAVAEALVAADLDGIPSHGLARLPAYADQVRAGKVNGWAQPEVSLPSPAAVRVDAGNGFAFPAISYGIAAGQEVAEQMGVALIGITRSHHCGVAGHHVERLAERGLVALMFANAPAAMAPWGGKRPVFGTDPIAFACPRRNDAPLVVDLSLSVTARGRIVLAARRGEPIPEGWALDVEGRPTTDAAAALAGSVLPMAGAKGSGLALMVEILAAALTGGKFGFEASSFLDAEGPPPGVGQLFVAIDPAVFGGGDFLGRVEALLQTVLAEDGVRLPGDRRLTERARRGMDGIDLPADLFDELLLRSRP